MGKVQNERTVQDMFITFTWNLKDDDDYDSNDW